MTQLTLTKTRIQAGTYEGVLRAGGDLDAGLELDAVHLEQSLGTLSIEEDNALDLTWHVRVPIPASVLSDGIQTFLIIDKSTGDTLDSFTVITGEPLDDDLRGEIDLLRAELDMLKKAFRRHCVETT